MANENDSQIIGYVASSYKIDADKITRDTTFDECGKGSMKMIALLAVIENEMDVEIPLREGMNMKTVGELCDRVEAEL